MRTPTVQVVGARWGARGLAVLAQLSSWHGIPPWYPPQRCFNDGGLHSLERRDGLAPMKFESRIGMKGSKHGAAVFLKL